MAVNIEQDLERMLEAIIVNANYQTDYDIISLNILLDCDFYFDICQIIFPEFNIKLIKIKENEGLQPGLKLQYLIDVLSRELQIDLSSIKGHEIVKGHLLHIHHFLQFLEKFSELEEGNGGGAEEQEDESSRRVKSDEPNTSERIQKDVPRSARQKIKYKQSASEHERSEQKNKQKRNKSKKRRPYSAKKPHKTRNQHENLHGELINIMVNEKNRALTASMRDNRKKKNTSIIEAKNKYKSYLLNHAKQQRASKNRQRLKERQKKVYRELPLEDYGTIENHFKNFSYKLREAKYRYLKRLQKTIRDQQMDRMCYENRVKREGKKQAEQKIKKELQRINNEHLIKAKLLKQQFESDSHATKLMKKQFSRYERNQKKELKDSKKQELKKIKEFIDQENQKVLMNLEEGGALEKMIVHMYKRL